MARKKKAVVFEPCFIKDDHTMITYTCNCNTLDEFNKARNQRIAEIKEKNKK